MAKLKKYRINGITLNTHEAASLFGINRRTFNNRLSTGWKIVKGLMINTNIRKERWKRDFAISKEEYKKISSSFIGDSETAENIYC